VRDRIWDAPENPTLHPLVADHQQVGAGALREFDERLRRVSLAGTRHALDALAPELPLGSGQDLSKLGRGIPGEFRLIDMAAG
jgi:hypothetical protein